MCQAGFANRLRALVSGICLAQDLSANLVVFWEATNPACGSSLESLISPASWPHGMMCDTGRLPGAQSCLSFTDLSGILTSWDRQQPLKIQSYGKFYTQDDTRWLQNLRSLQPCRQVFERVNKMFESMDLSSCVGVHIRRGDNIKSIQASPFALFAQRLSQETAKHIVVASDDNDVKDSLNSMFPGRCIFPSAVQGRNTTVGMVNGLMDFFALAKCPRLIGSAHSSFSEMAVAYGGGTLEILSV